MKINNKTRQINNTVENTRNFQIVEAYRTLRTNLQFALGNKAGKCKKIAVTSSLPKEGKTLTSINLAITFAQTDARVLIIDCDMRRPRVHRYFELESRVGLSNVLSGMCTFDEAVKKAGGLNLSVLPAGLIPPNPVELLSGDNMKNLLDELSESFDYIILDTPPINIVADALSVANLVDGNIIVLSSASSTHIETKKAVSQFEYANANILGFVLNNVNTKNTKGYSKKYMYYGYR